MCEADGTGRSCILLDQIVQSCKTPMINESEPVFEASLMNTTSAEYPSGKSLEVLDGSADFPF